MSVKPKLDSSILIIFGITGDLAKRKVLPAIYHLCKDNLLNENTKIIGISRREINKKRDTRSCQFINQRTEQY